MEGCVKYNVFIVAATKKILPAGLEPATPGLKGDNESHPDRMKINTVKVFDSQELRCSTN